MQQVITTARHRNGMAGRGFQVTLFSDDEINPGHVMLGIQFDGDHDGPSLEHTAVLDLELLLQHNVEFGENSWRCEDFDRFLADQAFNPYESLARP